MTSYPLVLEGLSGMVVNNMGVGGETSATIACRQGGRIMLVNNFTIPADTSNVQVGSSDNPMLDNFGTAVRPLYQGSAGVNPCYINGIKGGLSISITDDSYTYYFSRETAGEEVVVNRPTPIVTDAQINRRSDILIIFIGQNGGYSDNDNLINQIRSMVDFNKFKEYVVLGLTTDTETARADLEAAMLQAFGRRYINLREYLSTYGLADAGLEPTEQDAADMANGSTPTSLRVDAVHLNAYGYTIIGNLVYKKLIELNII